MTTPTRLETHLTQVMQYINGDTRAATQLHATYGCSESDAITSTRKAFNAVADAMLAAHYSGMTGQAVTDALRDASMRLLDALRAMQGK